MNQRHIPVCTPHFLGKELEYATDALKSGWISSSGQYLSKFEKGFSQYCDCKHGIATTNGTSAIHLALKALGIQEGDEVIMPDFTMIAVLFAVLYLRAKPVLIDADPQTWNMQAGEIERKITPRTKAIIAVHTYGHPCDMDMIMETAKKHKLLVLEDAAEAHGARYKGKVCGSTGDVSTFSFYANKIITTGEGGMVVTKLDEIAEKCRYYRNLCFPLKGSRDFRHDDLGFNYRMTNVQAALGLGQLEKIEELIKRRRANAACYSSLLKGVDALELPAEKPDIKNVYWMYGVLINAEKIGMNRDEFAAELANKGIETRPFFRPMHSQKSFQDVSKNAEEKFPVSDDLAERGLYLPSGSGLTRKEIEYIAGVIKTLASSKSAA